MVTRCVRFSAQVWRFPPDGWHLVKASDKTVRHQIEFRHSRLMPAYREAFAEAQAVYARADDYDARILAVQEQFLALPGVTRTEHSRQVYLRHHGIVDVTPERVHFSHLSVSIEQGLAIARILLQS